MHNNDYRRAIGAAIRALTPERETTGLYNRERKAVRALLSALGYKTLKEFYTWEVES